MINVTPETKQENYLNKKADLANLLDYYRLVVDTFENERMRNYDLFQNIKISNEEQHNLDWEIKRRKDEII